MRARKARGLVLATIGCACLLGAAIAFAAETFSTQAYFTPDKLGAPANLSATAVFSSNGTVPTPISHVLAYGPAGLRVDVAGTGVCDKAKLEAQGTGACPADSRIGFGGGVGLVEIGGEVVKEPFTLDFFLGPRESGHLTILVYAQAHSPVQVELVVVVKEVHGSKPYGFGVEFEIPPIATLPGAAYASVEKSYFTIGSQHIAYYNLVHGKRKLVHVKGLIVPNSCPKGGFPFTVTITFLDGTKSTDTYAAPCPAK
ncbi:MAG TPA: hypothetical protein VK272_10750 [Solirubrobacteraceae bacterium]|nr:hypothetical protein [Solirubrobacteraceae bacterium]